MPTYQYRCSDCGHEFDQYQKFSESALTVCPSCNGSIRRVIQPVGVVFKGSGWYINDSKKSENGSAAAPKKTEAGVAEKTASPAAAEATASAEKADKAEKTEKSEPKEAAPAAKPSAPAGATASA